MQQAVQALWPQMPFVSGMLLAMGLALAAGYASWHLVEAPALRLKRMLA